MWHHHSLLNVDIVTSFRYINWTFFFFFFLNSFNIFLFCFCFLLISVLINVGRPMTLLSLRDLFDNQIEYLPDTVFDSLENLINLWVIHFLLLLRNHFYMMSTLHADDSFSQSSIHLFTLMLDILARWKTRRAISHFRLHSVVVLLTRRIFFFYLILLRQEDTQK